MGEIFYHHGGALHITRTGNADAPARLVLLHGWRQPAASLLPVISTLQRDYVVIGLDTPGNGVAPPPPATWGLADYVDLVAAWLASQPVMPTIFVCHSFGCRLAMHLAARGVDGLRAMVVIGGHGLKPQRSLRQRLRVLGIVRVTKFFGALDRAFNLGLKARWAARFGSADYRAADGMRDVFIRIIHDDVAPLLGRVTVPVLLLYGMRDTETPPSMGQRYQQLLPKARYIELPADDHYTVLTSGASIVQTKIKEFLQGLKP